MLFNSLDFLLFFPIVCITYWILPNKIRNPFLLIASYYFYLNWKPIYGLLIFCSTIITWLCSLGIDKTEKKEYKKSILLFCLISNLYILFLFKYANFFTSSVNACFEMLGIRLEIPQMNILLPVGISFYTFQAIGYTIDVYRKTILPEKNFFTYALFVSFFPQLVAGPIERAKNLLPQFHSKHIFNQEKALEGLKLMIWGYFMKLCIAERLSPYVDAVYNNYHQHNGTSLLLATFFFTFQIFCDFGGYSLIAIGAAKCMNFELMQNFNRPYFAINIKQFWRKWHISLSTWFMDYVYIPLGGNRCKTTKHLKNLFVTFFVSGLWHGANWTFIAWGSLHGIYLIVGILKNKYLPKVKAPSVIHTIVNVIVTFCLVMFAWIFFRANDITSAFAIIKKIFTEPGALYNGDGLPNQLLGLLCIGILMMKELKDEMNLKINFMHNENVVISTVSMAAMVSFILLTAVYTGGQFIYFQF